MKPPKGVKSNHVDYLSNRLIVSSISDSETFKPLFSSIRGSDSDLLTSCTSIWSLEGQSTSDTVFICGKMQLRNLLWLTGMRMKMDPPISTVGT